MGILWDHYAAYCWFIVGSPIRFAVLRKIKRCKIEENYYLFIILNSIANVLFDPVQLSSRSALDSHLVIPVSTDVMILSAGLHTCSMLALRRFARNYDY